MYKGRDHQGVFARTSGSSKRTRRSSLGAVCGGRPFADAIRYECARAERTSDSLALVTFEPHRRDPRSTLRLARMIVHRARLTDLVGWLDDGCIGVLLPNTRIDGATRFAHSLQQLAERSSLSFTYRTYIYPANGHSRSSNRPPSSDGENHKPMNGGETLPVLHTPDSINGFRLPHQWIAGRDVSVPLPAWKREIDIVLAAAGLVLLSPIMLIAAAMVKLSSPGPVLFRQWRAGLAGKPFLILKFRSMVVDAEGQKAPLRCHSSQDGPAFKVRNDPRVTRVGRFLRKSSIDELPQLWNVLKGDMSLVGPRPLPIDEAAECLPWQNRRVDVVPGLTCTWQVEGRSRVTFDEWMRMDRAYIRRRSLARDLLILLKTIPAVLLRRGAY